MSVNQVCSLSRQAKSLPNLSLSYITLQETLASPSTACYESGWRAASRRSPLLLSLWSPSLWAWKGKKTHPTDLGVAIAKKQIEECAYPMPVSGSLQKVSVSTRIGPLGAAGSWGWYSSRHIAEGAWGPLSPGRSHQRYRLSCPGLLPSPHGWVSPSPRRHFHSWFPGRWLCQQQWCWRWRRTPWRGAMGIFKKGKKRKQNKKLVIINSRNRNTCI